MPMKTAGVSTFSIQMICEARHIQAACKIPIHLIYYQIHPYVLDEILRVERLKKHFVKKRLFGAEASVTRAADGVSFSIRAGEVFVLAGESGSGKSTIAKMILGAVSPDSGRIVFDGREVRQDGHDIKGLRMSCQMIHQDPYDSINPRMKVGDIVAEPLEIHGVGDKNIREGRVIEVLQEVKLEPAGEMLKKYPHMLSGGQRQRVVLARALATRPKIILADEPVSMLDVSIRAEMLDLMQALQKRHGIAFVYITHDLATARHFGQRIGILYMGKIVETGRIEDVLQKPMHPYTQALIDAISEPDPRNLHGEKKIRIREPEPGQGLSGCRFSDKCPYVMEQCGTEPELEERRGRFVACYADFD